MNSQAPAKKKPSAVRRYLYVLLVGLLLGAVATILAWRALQSRQDPFPSSLMQVMQRHHAMLEQSVQQNRCDSTDILPHLRTLRALGDDLEPAFPGLARNEGFATHSAQFRAKLDAALRIPPANCDAVANLAVLVKDSCAGCHQDFR